VAQLSTLGHKIGLMIYRVDWFGEDHRQSGSDEEVVTVLRTDQPEA
jgi:hypothetical protein